MVEIIDDLVPSANLAAFVRGREHVAGKLAEVFQLLNDVDRSMVDLGVVGGVLSLLSESLLQIYGRERLLNDLFQAPELLTKRLDANLWDVLFKASGVRSFMDAEARAAFKKDRDALKIAPFTEAIVRDTFKGLYADRDKMFADGVENLFRKLSWDHKTNRPIGFGRKFILRIRTYSATRGIDPDCANIVDDLVRAMCVLTGKPEPDHRHGTLRVLDPILSASDRGEWQGEFFAIRWFKNGFAHFIFNNQELADRLNKVLAARYPMALANFA